MKKPPFLLLALYCAFLPWTGVPPVYAASARGIAFDHSSPAEDKMALEVTHNNPFNPSRGQTTKFRFRAKGANRILRVRVYTPAGILVREFPEQLAAVNIFYEITWDGKNEDGQVVARGIYLVSIQEAGTSTRGIVRKVAVIR